MPSTRLPRSVPLVRPASTEEIEGPRQSRSDHWGELVAGRQPRRRPPHPVDRPNMTTTDFVMTIWQIRAVDTSMRRGPRPKCDSSTSTRNTRTSSRSVRSPRGHRLPAATAASRSDDSVHAAAQQAAPFDMWRTGNPNHSARCLQAHAVCSRPDLRDQRKGRHDQDNVLFWPTVSSEAPSALSVSGRSTTDENLH